MLFHLTYSTPFFLHDLDILLIKSFFQDETLNTYNF